MNFQPPDTPEDTRELGDVIDDLHQELAQSKKEAEQAKLEVLMLREALEITYQKKYHGVKIDKVEQAITSTAESAAKYKAEIKPSKYITLFGNRVLRSEVDDLLKAETESDIDRATRRT